MGLIQIEMRRKRNPNPNPKDVEVLPRRHVGSTVLDLQDGLWEAGSVGPPPLVGSPACQLQSPPKGSKPPPLVGARC
jgi:hypothetical protein